jgi:polyisoprenoid-binding protein YceI
MIATTTQPLTLIVDKVHSEATFEVRHLITKVRGRFTDFDGTIQLDEQNPAASTVKLSIRTASVDTNVADRDAHLRSADFFDVEKFPTIEFVSSRVEKAGPDRFVATGNLSIRGITREVTIPVTALGTAKDPWGNVKAGFEAETTLNRKDFGLTWNAALETGGFLVGDEVKVGFSIQALITQ